MALEPLLVVLEACKVTLVQVLLVEDDARLGPLVKRALETDGHTVVLARSAAEALGIDVAEVEVAVIDWMLPDGDGLTVAAVLGSRGFHAPVLVLTARSETRERVHALDTVADDYLTKPFAVAELRARVRALGRRAPETRSAGTRVGDATLDLAARRALVDGAEISLTAKEWEIVAFLVARRGRLVRRGDLVDGVWGGAEGALGSLEVLVARIRKKLGAGAVRTVRGEGYAID